MSKDAVRETYAGARGRDYQQQVFLADQFVQDTIARERARKLQPFINASDSVLEYGVGQGLNLRFIQCKRRVGYDVYDGGKLAAQNGIEFTADLNTLSNERFDVIVCHHVLEHVPDPYDALEQMKGLLRAGGKLIVCVPFETNRMYRRYFAGEPNRHLFSWNALTLGNLVTAAGFEVLDARVRPFSYEQRLAFLVRFGTWIYRSALWLARKVRPSDEVMLIAKGNEPRTK